MRHRTLMSLAFLVIAAAAQAAGPAPAAKTAVAPASYEYTARLAAPVRHPDPVNAAGIRWQCAADRCTVRGPWPVPGVNACRALAQQVGRVRSYGHAGRQLTGAELSECNRGIGVAPSIADTKTSPAPALPTIGGAPKPAAPIGKVAPPQAAQGWSPAEPIDAARSAPPNSVYQLDRESGSVSFGDGERGNRPPAGGAGITPQYRSGSGAPGNLPAPEMAPKSLPPSTKIQPRKRPAAGGGFAPRAPTASGPTNRVLAGPSFVGAALITHRDLNGPNFVGTPLVTERTLDGPVFIGTRLVMSRELNGPNFIGSRIAGP